jgi:UDP-glucuronate 4-epimerase
MALFLFTKSILDGKEIEVFNNGDHVRDFTYVDDIAESIVRVHLKSSPVNNRWDPKFPDPASSKAPFNLYNIGNSNPVPLMSYIQEIEKNLSKSAKLKFLPLQKGDVHTTIADASKLENFINYKPSTSIEHGIKEFIDWYFKYFRLNP